VISESVYLFRLPVIWYVTYVSWCMVAEVSEHTAGAILKGPMDGIGYTEVSITRHQARIRKITLDRRPLKYTVEEARYICSLLLIADPQTLFLLGV
jgi:hypothetical protein